MKQVVRQLLSCPRPLRTHTRLRRRRSHDTAISLPPRCLIQCRLRRSRLRARTRHTPTPTRRMARLFRQTTHLRLRPRSVHDYLLHLALDHLSLHKALRCRMVYRMCHRLLVAIIKCTTPSALTPRTRSTTHRMPIRRKALSICHSRIMHRRASISMLRTLSNNINNINISSTRIKTSNIVHLCKHPHPCKT